MAQMMIRNLDDSATAVLRARAARHRTSVEEEARRAINDSTKPEMEALIARMNAISARIGVLPGPAIVEDLRADRARDDAF